MTDFLDGIIAFFLVAFCIAAVTELSAILEELFGVRVELRKGFTGAKTTPLRILSRHLLNFLRMQGTFRQHFGAGLKYIFIFAAAGLLPMWNGEAAIPINHSLWIFLALTLLGPVLHLVFEWIVKKGAGWPIVLMSAERAIGSATVLFILSITLVAMTGADNLHDFQNLQNDHGWLIIHNPLAIPLLIAFAVVNLFSNFETIFSRTGGDKQEGWSLNELLLPLRRSVWAIFMADVFLGGSGGFGIVFGLGGAVLLVIKSVAINLVSSMVSHLFFQLREDQAESFILWRLGPVSIVILALCLLFPGGLT